MNKIYNLANKLIDAQINGKVISPSEYNFLKTTEEAYSFQDISEKIFKIEKVGWKIGATSLKAQKYLKDGDIVNIDVTAIVNGWHGDTSRMFFVGDVSVKSKNLVSTTYNSMMRAIAIIKSGVNLGDIGEAIQTYVEKKGFSVVRDYCGHCIGKTFHEPPNILHYGKKGEGIKLETGMIFTVEPMINEGIYNTKLLNDGWTAVTKDKLLSAQFEHTIGVTKDGFEIFTKSKKKYEQPPYLI